MAKKKKKSRIKKLLKGAALAGAAVLGAKALGRRNQMKDYLATEGGDRSVVSPINKIIGTVLPKKRRDSILGKPGINRMDTSEVDFDYTAPSTAQYRNMDMGLQGYYKKGGRVGCGVAKKGFGRALKKGGKK
tara:strand:+ start:181 stop:576 length:396 start_codon:yes stop_codon:yes gene_type:complete